MAIVAGFDVHRAQITFDALDQQTGEVSRGRMLAAPEPRKKAGRKVGRTARPPVLPAEPEINRSLIVGGD
jgi:hypothetical protein